MRFAYADPPYLGWSKRYYGELHEEAADYDDPETHRALIQRLSEFDGWAMSLHSPALRTILPMCPQDVRVMAWCKSFASYKPGVHPAYAWEPVIIRGPRTRRRDETTIADFHVAKITLERGLTGAKPESFVWWVLAAPELWQHVVSNTGRSPEARHEALQIAAMALRYIIDLCDPR